MKRASPVVQGRRRAHGFGLLEAVVALALLAGTGLALFSWIEQSLQSATRLRTAELEARLLRTAQALMESVNPSEQAQGEILVSGLIVRWTGDLVEAPRPNFTSAIGGPGPWLVGLYRLQVSARDDKTATAVQFVQLRTGLHRLSKVETRP